MQRKITRDVLESSLSCEFKAHLKLAGERGTQGDYESLLLGVRGEIRSRATAALRAQVQDGQIANKIRINPDALSRGCPLILDGTLEDDTLSVLFDGLKRAEGTSKLGDFHYVPVMFHEGRKLRKAVRVLLAIYGLLLEPLQGVAPSSGVIWHGPDLTATRVGLSGHRRAAERILTGLRELVRSGSPPALILNDHCPACEFRDGCRSRAVRDDNLSLLLGMGQKEIGAYNRKGFFTVTQLSHTFRYRKPRKRARTHAYPHYYSLQARAIRTGIVHLHGSPSLPVSPTRVYFDIEGVPDRDFHYLIGALVETGPDLTHYQFWADRDEEQNNVFRRFAEFVGALPPDTRLFHYGAYEATALKQARERLPAEEQEPLRALTDRLVNVLAVVHRHAYFPTYSNSLKEIGRFLGCQWANPAASGIQSLYWREMWERTHDPRLKEQLIQYNRDDCAALRAVCRFLAEARTSAAAEGTFLNEFLAGFRGVLVSDFFSAYESVNCPQQKCLLHFLRDINDDLQRNPFDAEFKAFAQEFAGLLRGIVETADRHGLAKKFLARHVPAARRFQERVTGGSFSSVVMLGYQKRVRKAAGRLFTFLEYDEVPWNNNNAEHAMKVFAKFRRLADGKFTERSLAESLVLLSVCQTCHFNGVNVLRFLLSGRSDLPSVLSGISGKPGEPIAGGGGDS